MNLLYVVGIGPGDYQNMTLEAEAVLKESEVITGYTVYVNLIREHFPGKEYIVTGMKQEKERCRLALEAAADGKQTAVVCSGDAGVYGMAGILMEMGSDYPQVEIRVVAGVTAALSGAAVLGAPVGHDFAVISLSDLMTPWEKIQKRLEGAAMADFIICLYNPSSRKRKDYLKRACTKISISGYGLWLCKKYRKRRATKETAVIIRTFEYTGRYVYDSFYWKFTDEKNWGPDGNSERISGTVGGKKNGRDCCIWRNDRRTFDRRSFSEYEIGYFYQCCDGIWGIPASK